MNATSIAQIRDAAAASLSPVRQEEWEQFLTPMPVAEQAAGLFTPSEKPVRILDLGAGTGILGAVTAGHAEAGSSVTAIERDSALAAYAKESLRQTCDNVKVINRSVFDVLLDAAYDRVILNPPYRKIAPMALATDGGGVKVTNLYAAFLVLAIQALADGGECVAIIPRSWMNGGYFKDFRQWMLSECNLDAMVVYASRQEHFKDMNILQEIMLLKVSKKVSKRPQTNTVRVWAEASPSRPLSEQAHDTVPLDALLMGRDRIVRTQRQDARLKGFETLRDRGMWVSTGKLVWFRNRDVLSAEEPADGGHPLYWSDNRQGLTMSHPVGGDREQWVTAEADDRHVVLPAGDYCMVNRFSAKEQRRRIQAAYLHSDVPFVADNKLNYIHQGTSRTTVPLDAEVARGLTLWLSSSVTDEWYRQTSGSTQVNATDLRQLPCPSLRQLRLLAQALPFESGVGAAESDVERFLDAHPSYQSLSEERRNMPKTPVSLPSGEALSLSPSGQSVLIKAMVEEMLPRFAPGCKVIYIDDTDHRHGVIDAALMSRLGIGLKAREKAPDVIAWDARRGWLFLMEAASTHGPVDVTRKAELRALFADQWDKVVLVSCFPDRRTMQRYLAVLAWETEAWCADEPDHMVHLDGARFMGPYGADD